MNIILTSTRLFRGIDTAQLQPLLQCLGAVRKRYARGETILAAGAPTEQLGMVLSGMAMMATMTSGAVTACSVTSRPERYLPNPTPVFRGNRCVSA